MMYEAELRLLRETFRKCRIQTLLMDPHVSLDLRADMGLMQFLSDIKTDKITFTDVVPALEKQTVYRLSDWFGRRYVYLLLPDLPQETVLLIGPYVSKPLEQKDILEMAEKWGVPPKMFKEMESYYGNLPILLENSHLFALLDTFAERIWGGSGRYVVEDLDQNEGQGGLPISIRGDNDDAEKTAWNIQIMEERYAYENELMQAVAQGQTQKVEILMGGFSSIHFEKRLADPVRNLKNYSIIMNTLLRKAAEQGGVHPVYLDSTSSAFARKIEMMTSTEQVQELMVEMFRTYCRLVRKHALKRYSPPVQKAIITIDSDLSADLSLSTLAEMQGISASYLSALFKNETGETLTEHVNKKRIRLAQQLLETTTLQIQTIAQHCGILDVHYFSKVFKRYAGCSPKQYRDSCKEA